MLQQVMILLLELANFVVDLALLLALALLLPLGLLLILGIQGWTSLSGKTSKRKDEQYRNRNRQHEHITKSHGISSVKNPVCTGRAGLKFYPYFGGA